MYLIMYDIESDRLRTHFSKFLEKYGRRLQYSVFEVQNSTRILDNIRADIVNKFEKRFSQGDNVLIYRVPDDSCIEKFGFPINEEGDLVFG